MKKQIHFAILLSLSVFLLSPAIFAQVEQDAEAAAADSGDATREEPEVSRSQEVEITEDNYRQFMELKDNNLQRGVIPETVFKPDSGLQKLEKLPEESQKHLRNELREIIVQGDPWQPGDENKEYPYAPSQAASGDPSLQEQELEAWGELVDSYHQREAQIYENSAGRRAASGSEDGNRNTPGDGAGADGGAGESEEGRLGQQAGQQDSADQNDGAGTYSPGASNDSSATSTEGVSQNAMEFLRGLGQSDGDKASGNEGTATEEGATPGDLLSDAGSSNGQTGEQTASGKSQSEAIDTQSPYRDSDTDSTADASQNAMKFLQENAGQANMQSSAQRSSAAGNYNKAQTQEGQKPQKPEEAVVNSSETETSTTASATPVEESTNGASQNALEYLTGEKVQSADTAQDDALEAQPEDTLTIQELLNAQGIGSPTVSEPVVDDPHDERHPKPEKDSDG